MSPSATVLEIAAAYRKGLEVALTQAGFDVAGPDATADVVLAPLRAAADCEVVEALAAAGVSAVVALLSPADTDGYAHAFGNGVAAAAPYDAEPEEIAATAQAAVRGTAVVPSDIAVSLARRAGDPHRHPPPLDQVELDWILALAKGATVVEIADRHGYSERAMFRKLGDVYARLGASNRAEALVAAGRLGLLDTEPA